MHISHGMMWTRRTSFPPRESSGNGGGGSRRGFSLLEMSFVVIVIATVTGIAVSRSGSSVTNSQAAAAKETVRVVQAQIDEYYALYGSYPTRLDPEWFRDLRVPINPLVPAQLNHYEVVSGGSALHPRDLAVSSTSTPGFWYNATNGVLRARVPSSGDSGWVLVLYGSANGSAPPVPGDPVGTDPSPIGVIVKGDPSTRVAAQGHVVQAMQAVEEN